MVDEDVSNLHTIVFKNVARIFELEDMVDKMSAQKQDRGRLYDLEEETIKLKFHRERDRILCQTVELLGETPP